MTTPRLSAPAEWLLPLALGTLALLSPAATIFAQPPAPGPASTAFLIIGEYLLEIDGSIEDNARIYHSQRRASILVRSDALSYTLELQPRDRSILAWPGDQVVANADGTVEVRGQGQPGGQFELSDNLPVFSAEGKKVRFLIKPAVLGTYDAAALEKKSPVYAERAKLHEPQPVYMEKLKNLEEELHIRVFFGSWCDVCTQMMPRILRTEEALKEIGAPVTFEYYGIPNDYKDPEVERLGVNGLPTGIFYLQGKEMGRVVGHGWNFPSMAIYNQLLRPHDQTPPRRQGN